MTFTLTALFSSVFCWICLRQLSYPSCFQEDFEFHGQAQFQDPRSTSESTTPMEGENMGGWWPEHSTPDTGVRPARQRPLACTWSSAHSSGKCSVTLTLQTYFYYYYYLSVGLWLLVGFVFIFSTRQFCEWKAWVVCIGILCWTYWD